MRSTHPLRFLALASWVMFPIMGLFACQAPVAPVDDDEPGVTDPGPVVALGDLDFAVGTWKTSGSQDFGNGVRVLHKGIVEASLSRDGRTLERVFWATFDNGASLGGRSVHALDTTAGAWFGRWIPTSGVWNATPARGGFRGDDYFETATGNDGTGNYTSFTRFFDIGENGYRVVSDLHYASGLISEDNWTIRFERVPEEVPGDSAGHDGTLSFLLGEWDAVGTLRLPNGSMATHRSYVDAHLAPDNKTVQREHWGAISNGAALRGRAEHTPDTLTGTWLSSWTPRGTASTGAAATGQFEADEFVEREAQQLPNGPATVRTRYFDITSTSYSVQTDIVHANGSVTTATWTAHFRRIG